MTIYEVIELDHILNLYNQHSTKLVDTTEEIKTAKLTLIDKVIISTDFGDNHKNKRRDEADRRLIQLIGGDGHDIAKLRHDYGEEMDYIINQMFGANDLLHIDNKHYVYEDIVRVVLMQVPSMVVKNSELSAAVFEVINQAEDKKFTEPQAKSIRYALERWDHYGINFYKALGDKNSPYRKKYDESISPSIDRLIKLLTEYKSGTSVTREQVVQFYGEITELNSNYYDLYLEAEKEYVREMELFSEGLRYDKIILIVVTFIATFGLIGLFTFLYRNMIKYENAERTQRQQGLLLNTLLDYMPLSIFAKDAAQNYQYVVINKKAEEVFGYTKEEMLGKGDYDFFPRHEADFFRQTDLKVMEENKVVDIEQEDVMTASGPIIAHTIKVPIFDRKKKYSILLGIFEDVTQKIAEKEELKKAKIAAENANLAKSEFLANMSHELRTPLNSIIGMGTLMMDGKLDDEQKEMLEVIARSSHSLLSIVNDILDLAKIESKAVILEHIPFNISQASRHVVQQQLPIASAKGLTVSCDLSDNNVYVMGDPLRYSRIITNLLSNAIRYTERGSVRANFEFMQEEELCLITAVIEDTGIGIAEDRISTIFEKFTQEDTSTTRKYGGTGLGLAIVKQLVDLMRGTVEVSSKKGIGTKFTMQISLPYADASAILEHDFKVSATVNTSQAYLDTNARILVAEDHEINQHLIKRIMGRFGLNNYKIVENGAEALKEVETGQYDMVFMDCHMPVMSGYDTASSIRKLKDPRQSSIPIIAMTANAMQGEREKCLSYGMNDYISKPLNIEKLKALLSQWIIFSDTDNEMGASAEAKAEEIGELVDLTVLKDTSMGDDAFLLEMINLFVVQAEKQIHKLEEYCVDGECEEWVETSHALKGSAGSVGAHVMRQMAANAQDMKDATAEYRRIKVNKLREAYKMVIGYFIQKGYLKEN